MLTVEAFIKICKLIAQDKEAPTILRYHALELGYGLSLEIRNLPERRDNVVPFPRTRH